MPLSEEKIPADVREAAEKVGGLLGHKGYTIGVHWIAGAIAAERERCAKIVETGEGWHEAYMAAPDDVGMQSFIAAALRARPALSSSLETKGEGAE